MIELSLIVSGVFYSVGLSSIHYTYQENTNLIKNIDTIEPGFELKNEFNYQSGLLNSEKLRFGTKTNLHNIETR